MQQQERINDLGEALRLALDGLARRINCAAIGIVQSYDGKSVVVNLAIQAVITAPDGTQTLETINPLIDVPVVFMGGGSMVTTYPISEGDEALVVFADRCVDAWWQSGGIQKAAEPRVHSLSDGFAIVGPRSLARALPNVSMTTAQFRTLDGSTYFEVASGGQANIVAPNGVTVTGPLTVDGNVTVTGAVSATQEGTFNGIPVSAHVHGGVQTGSGDTGAPIA